jgi:hypothetical protein
MIRFGEVNDVFPPPVIDDVSFYSNDRLKVRVPRGKNKNDDGNKAIVVVPRVNNSVIPT